jgi:hypothetical protein
MPARIRDSLFFALCFTLLFSLLVFPWPGFRPAFAEILRRELRMAMKWAFPGYVVEVQAHVDQGHPSMDIEIQVSDPRRIRPDGKFPVQVATFDSRSVGWMPHAMGLALCGATTLPRKKRWKVLAVCLACTHILTLITFLAGVCSSLVEEGSARFLYWLVVGFDHVLVKNLWMSFVGPFVLWLTALLVFEDGFLFFSGAEDTSRPAGRDRPAPLKTKRKYHGAFVLSTNRQKYR